MTIQEANQLMPGDEVFWNDSDYGICSRSYVISEIDIEDGIVKITDPDGDYLECSLDELS